MPACEHCLIAFDEREAVRDEEGREFCCEGCRAVYGFIQGEGLSDFYKRREREWSAGSPAPAPADVFDTSLFEEVSRDTDEGRETDFYIDGIRCASCVWLVEKMLERTEGVRSARVNYATHRARVVRDPAAVSLEEILRRITMTGYFPKPWSESERTRARQAESRDLLIRFGTAAFLSSQLMIYTLALYAGYFQGMDPRFRRAFEVIAMILTAPVLLYSGLPLVRNTLSGLRRFRFNMDSLIVLGAGSAYIYSLFSMVKGGEVYFDTAAMIVTLILLGRYIESRAKGRASEAVERLAELAPRTATVVERDGTGERKVVDAVLLKPGMNVEVRPGEKFAADGTVLRGESSADESLITGEARPVPKKRGDTVIGGSINRLGSLVFEVTRSGRDTVLASIIRTVEDAQMARPSIQGAADRVVGVFVPVILIAAALTAVSYAISGAGAERALMTAVSVLVIACPCSLGLATPLAILVSTGLASSRGILVKGGDVLERTARTDAAVLDKTGTVTAGSMRLLRVLVLDDGVDERYCLDLASSVESLSEHGIAAAVIDAAAGRSPFAVENFMAVPGKGVSAKADGRHVAIGSRVLMDVQGLAFPPGGGEGDFEREAASRGESTICLGWDGQVRALFSFSDGLRPEAAEAAAQLEKRGVHPSIVSGDADGATASVARRTGISDYTAGASPAGKREIVAALQAGGGTVMMVGDGINDAPALAEAAVGVAIGRGTDIAMESADMVLTRNDLMLLPWLVDLARRTYRIIRQNIFWSFFYNIVAVPLAVAGVLHPIVAAGAMATSSLFVVGNSLRLRNLTGLEG
jgi:Cu2+-exporting ATPase